MPDDRKILFSLRCLYQVYDNSSDGADQSIVSCKFYAIDNDLRICDMLQVQFETPEGNLFAIFALMA